MSDTATVSDSVTDEIDSKLAAADATAAEVQAEDAADPTHDHDPEALADAAEKVGASDEAAEPVKQTGKVKSGADRRPRGWLETDVKAITDAFVQGEITLPEGQALTPHRLSRLVKERDNLEEAPSTGACAAVLARWVDLGFAEVNEHPYSFKDYTEAGRTQGLSALKLARSDNRKAARLAAKEALDAANPKPKRQRTKKAPDASAPSDAEASAATDPSGNGNAEPTVD